MHKVLTAHSANVLRYVSWKTEWLHSEFTEENISS